jgi:hypothetical protein
MVLEVLEVLKVLEVLEPGFWDPRGARGGP